MSNFKSKEEQFKRKIPELLVPVGNNETFYAALEAGADAIYLGLRHFNARERAVNFTNAQIQGIINEARKKNCKVYITLNTVIKNKEIPELLDVLYFLEKVKPDAVIIQDWGIYFIIKNHFPDIPIHASTQMANHNSLGVNYSDDKGIERIILARELTLNELKEIKHKTKSELEIFIHGALCYSFSGMCHFSSYLGGHGANRGYCTQPCRRLFDTGKNSKYFFSLKDNQQIDLIEEFAKIGIASLKIEGRLKSDDYVYRIARAYRKALDNPQELKEAKKILSPDTGRKKTSYFPGNDLKDVFTYSPNTGIYLGKITNVTNDEFQFKTSHKFANKFRLRIKDSKTGNQTNIKVKDFKQEGAIITVKSNKRFFINSDVFLSGIEEKKFPSKLPVVKSTINSTIPEQRKKTILKEITFKKEKTNNSLFIRIDSIKWMRKIFFDNIDNLILSFSKKEFENLRLDVNIIKKNRRKIWIEFPHFIPEDNIDFYKNLVSNFVKNGINSFFLSHISQKLLLPQNARFALNENVYIYNDAAIKFLKNEDAEFVTYPIENDKDNIESYSYKNGILPVYFHPQVFISRMPVEIPTDIPFKDDMKNEFSIKVKNGITYVVPLNPVSFLQYINEFKNMGFKRFLIDLSYEKPSGNRFNTLLKRFVSSRQIQPASNFNYKRELK